MDLKRIFSARVIGLIVLILVVLFLGAAFNANLEGLENPPVKDGNTKKDEKSPSVEGLKGNTKSSP